VIRLRDALADESGTSLIEVLLASMIFVIAGLAIVGGFLTSVLIADAGAKQAGAEAALRSAAEEVRAAGYDPACSPSYPVTAPTGFSAAVTGVDRYRADARVLSSPGGCEATDTQVLTLIVSSTDGTITASTNVVKRPDHAP
jgi:Tfp pilus assembly protein PilV